MSDVTINQLPTASTIDGSADIIPIYTASQQATQGINRNTLLGLSSAPVGLTDSQTLTNKTLTSPTISGPTLSGTVTGTYTLGGTPTFPSTVVTTTGSQTLTNKVLTSPTINSPTITNATISADAVTGYTTSNTGTIYGISVTTGTIGSAALAANAVTTTAISAAAVTAAKMVNGMVLERQGGTTGTGSWNTNGTSNTNTSSVNAFIQVGSIAGSATSGGDISVTFPTSYNQVPLVFATVESSNGSNQYCTVNSVTVSGFKIRQLNGTTSETLVWLAIGQ